MLPHKSPMVSLFHHKKCKIYSSQEWPFPAESHRHDEFVQRINYHRLHLIRQKRRLMADYLFWSHKDAIRKPLKVIHKFLHKRLYFNINYYIYTSIKCSRLLNPASLLCCIHVMTVICKQILNFNEYISNIYCNEKSVLYVFWKLCKYFFSLLKWK